MFVCHSRSPNDVSKSLKKMKAFTSPPATPTTVSGGPTTQPEPVFSSASSTTTTSQKTKSFPPTPICARPFDHWRPRGGGAEHDIFQRFKIAAIEEVAFLMHWAKKSSGRSILSHDEDGNLNIHINPADISELADMGISGLDDIDGKAQWLHVYDQEGVAWLTLSTNADQALTNKSRHTDGPDTFVGNKLGVYGPSGFTVKEFMEQHQLDCRHALSPKL
jgi:hypothetical protein